MAIRFFKLGAALKVLRTIETFLPYICGPVNQAFQISNRLEQKGVATLLCVGSNLFVITGAGLL